KRKANSYQGNVGIFGTVYVMCLVSVIQMAVSEAMARHREFHVLHSLGIGMRRLLNVVGTETLIAQLGGAWVVGSRARNPE
ncbi:MAG: ABC transporter permease, partial [Cutibacterium sp.]|nr:ABC transporter permease [Cutibacterium sp.]